MKKPNLNGRSLHNETLLRHNSPKFNEAFAWFSNPKFNNERLTIATIVTSRLKKDDVVLDIGGGGGTIWQIINETFPQKKPRRVDLIDANSERLKEAKNLNFSWLKTRHLDAKGLEQATDVYDLVLCAHFLPCLSFIEQKKTAKAIAKKVKKGGFVIIVQPSTDCPLRRVKRDLLQKITGHSIRPRRYLTLKEIKKYFKPSRKVQLKIKGGQIKVEKDYHLLLLAHFFLKEKWGSVPPQTIMEYLRSTAKQKTQGGKTILIFGLKNDFFLIEAA